jgi:hypothetical protein
MKKSERLLAEKFLLQCISDEDPDFVEHTMEKYGVSKSTVYNYLTTLQNNGEVERVGGSMPYRVLYRTNRITVDPTKDRSEDRLYNRDIAPLLSDLPQNVQRPMSMEAVPAVNDRASFTGQTDCILRTSSSVVSASMAGRPRNPGGREGSAGGNAPVLQPSLSLAKSALIIFSPPYLSAPQ